VAELVGRLEHLVSTGLQTGQHLARVLSQDETAFWQHVRELEEDPLFVRLWRGNGLCRAIRIIPRRFSAVGGVASTSARLSTDVEALLEAHRPLVDRLRALGPTVFSAYFLTGSGGSLAEIAEATGIDLEALTAFQRHVLDRVAIADMFSPPSEATGTASEAVARVEIRDGHLHLEMFHDRLRYQVDEAAVEALLRDAGRQSDDVTHWSRLRRRINWINVRYSLVHRVTEVACRAQEPFLLSGREDDLSVLEMKRVAADLGVHASWVTRLVRGRYVAAPAGDIPLRTLFRDQRQDAKTRGLKLMRTLVEEHRCASDADLQRALERHGVKVARRTVNAWRRALQGPRPSEDGW